MPFLNRIMRSLDTHEDFKTVLELSYSKPTLDSSDEATHFIPYSSLRSLPVDHDKMNSRLERSNSTATQFPGDIRLDEQRDVTPPAIVSPKRITGRDEPQASKLRKRRHDRQSESGIPNNDIDGDGFITLPPRLPPKLKAHESLFVSHESPSPEEQVFLPVKRASPWEYYNKIYRRELGGSVVVASKIPATFELFVVKSIAGLDVDDKAQVLRQVRHENILACYEIFGLHDAIFIVSEYMAISLTDLNGSAVPPSEIQIATIIHQVS